MTKSAVLVLTLLLLLIVAGCSGTPACLESQPYMQAKSFPPLKSPPGLDVPKPDPAMRIPEVASGPVGQFGDVPANRDTDNPSARCLATPPAMASVG